jgi:hypothetical protein
MMLATIPYKVFFPALWSWIFGANVGTAQPGESSHIVTHPLVEQPALAQIGIDAAAQGDAARATPKLPVSSEVLRTSLSILAGLLGQSPSRPFALEAVAERPRPSSGRASSGRCLPPSLSGWT